MDLSNIKELISQKQLSEKITELGAQISKEYRGKHLTVVGISNGVIPFLADLMRSITIPIQIDTISAESYSGKESTGEVKVRQGLKLEIKDSHVILVDDILDTGRTLTNIKAFLDTLGPVGIHTCVLLDKPSRRVVDIQADMVGFTIPDEFVVGFGLDYNEYYRNLPYIGIFSQD
jgi:hypoxanthine phosphoribosyltransferase